MRRKLPTIPSPKRKLIELAGFVGMNNTTHPTLLNPNVLTNIQNSFWRNGILEKRGGFVKEGDYLTTKYSEEFTDTTYKDATNTTANWDTVNKELNFL